MESSSGSNAPTRDSWSQPSKTANPGSSPSSTTKKRKTSLEEVLLQQVPKPTSVAKPQKEEITEIRTYARVLKDGDATLIEKAIRDLNHEREAIVAIIDEDNKRLVSLENGSAVENYSGERDSLRINISVNKMMLDDISKSVGEMSARLKLLKDQESEKIDVMETNTVEESPKEDWFLQSLLINEKTNRLVLPKSEKTPSLTKFSGYLLSLLMKVKDIKHFDVRYTSVETDLPVNEVQLLERLVKGFNELFDQKYALSVKDPEGDVKPILDIFIKSQFVSLGLVNWSQKRGQGQVKHFYYDVEADMFTRRITYPVLTQMLQRIFAFLHRLSENLPDRLRDILFLTIRKRKEFYFPQIKSEELTRRCPVLSLRTYKKYVLMSEWNTTLKMFSNENDISLEKRIQSGYAQRDLSPLLDRQSHNFAYRQNYFEKCKAFLDLRASRLKNLFPDTRFGKFKKGNPPKLEDVLHQSKKTAEERINLLDPMGLWLASVGYNSSRNPLTISLNVDIQHKQISLIPESVRTLYQIYLSRRDTRRDSNADMIQYESFLNMVNTGISEINTTINYLLT